MGSERVSLRWRGLIELATTRSQETVGKTGQKNTLTGIELSGDWQTLKPGSAIGYSRHFVESNGKPFVQNIECSVGESQPAAQTVASLQGLARKVTCASNNALKQSNVYLYLEAYDLFVETADTSTLMLQFSTLKAAQ